MGLSQKHIALICNYQLLENRVGGMDYFFWAFNEQCKENDIHVDWFFPNKASHGDYLNFVIIHSQNNSIEENFIRHIRSTRIQYSYIITHFVELCTSFYKNIKKFQSSIVVAVDHNSRPLNGYSIKKRVKKRIKGWLYSKHIDQFIGVSHYTSNAIIKDFGSFLKPKTSTIYNGVVLNDIEFRTSGRRTSNPKFIVVSHLVYTKGIQDLIQAVHMLPNELKTELKIDVYGDGPYKETLLTLVKSSNLETVFDFKGSSSTLKTQYKNYDYMLQPTHMECFSLSILESLAANIPVVTTPVGGNTEVVTNAVNGFIVQAKNVESLSELLKKLIIGAIGIQGTTRSLIEERFSIDEMVRNHIKLLA